MEKLARKEKMRRKVSEGAPRRRVDLRPGKGWCVCQTDRGSLWLQPSKGRQNPPRKAWAVGGVISRRAR